MDLTERTRPAMLKKRGDAKMSTLRKAIAVFCCFLLALSLAGRPDALL